MKVIVVDDDRDLADGTAEALRMKGFDILGTAYNGKDAVDLFQKFDPDCVITDFQMPECNGLCVLQKIREISPHTVVIFLTATLDTIRTRDLLDNGANEVILKPCKAEILSKVILKHLTPSDP